MYSQENCCNKLFADFKFQNIVDANPPEAKGVYVIRIKKRGKTSIEEMIRRTEKLVSKIGWKMVEEYVIGRVKRLSRIGKCPVIYIGSAAPRKGSKNTLKGRYRELSNRHTIMFPIWVLLYHGWQLEYGWKTCNNPKEEENKLKEKYKKMHSKLPSLVER